MAGFRFSTYSLFKARYGPSAILLFHVGKRYIAYEHDAVSMSFVLRIPYDIDAANNTFCCMFWDYAAHKCLNKLKEAGVPFVVIEQRSGKGSLIFPKAKQIKNDMKEDY